MDKFENINEGRFSGSVYVKKVIDTFVKNVSQDSEFGIGRRGLHPTLEEGFVYVGRRRPSNREIQLLYGDDINYPIALVSFDHQQRDLLIKNSEGYVRMFLPYSVVFADRIVNVKDALDSTRLLCLIHSWAKGNRLELVHPNGDEQDIGIDEDRKFFVLDHKLWQPSVK